MEVWKDVSGYEGFYQVSDHGRVKSLARTRKGRAGNECLIQERILCFGHTNGYPNVSLSREGSHITTSVHRLVAEAFISNPDNKPSVNHIDGVKANSRSSNLEWVTAQENMDHAVKLGLIKPVIGKDHYNAKLSDDQIREIRLRYKRYSRGPDSGQALAIEFGVSGASIHFVVTHQIMKAARVVK